MPNMDKGGHDLARVSGTVGDCEDECRRYGPGVCFGFAYFLSRAACWLVHRPHVNAQSDSYLTIAGSNTIQTSRALRVRLLSSTFTFQTAVRAMSSGKRSGCL